MFGCPRRFASFKRVSPTRGGVHANYDVGPDGRFLIVENVSPEQGSSLRVIVTWQALISQTR